MEYFFFTKKNMRFISVKSFFRKPNLIIEMKFNIGTRIALVRSKRNLSQIEMSELLSISPSAYSRLERNETQVSLEEIPRLADLLKIPIQDLLPEMFTVHNQPMLHSNGVVFCTNFYNFSNSKYNKEEFEVAIQDLQQNIDSLKKMNGFS